MRVQPTANETPRLVQCLVMSDPNASDPSCECVVRGGAHKNDTAALGPHIVWGWERIPGFDFRH